MEEVEFLGAVPSSDGRISLLVYADTSRGVIAWFSELDGARRLVGEDVFPRGKLSDAELIAEAGRRVRAVTGGTTHLEGARVLERTENRIPLSRYADDLAATSAVMESVTGLDFAVASEGFAAGYTAEERKMLPYLWDAYVYASALSNGSRSPAQAVAEERTISTRTAQSRVQHARKLGLLTPAARGELSGVLTPSANDLLARWYAYEKATTGGFQPLDMDGRK